MNSRIAGTGLRIAQAEKFQFIGLIAPVCLAAHRRHQVAVGDEGAGARHHLFALGNAGDDSRP